MRLTKRQRLLSLTAATGAVFLLGAIMIAWRERERGPVYRPGEQVEGLTSDLERSLPADHPTITFTDVTGAAGIAFRHFNATRTSQLPEDMGSGAAWGDFDGDGWTDLAIANEIGALDMPEATRRSAPPSITLYRNDRDGTFTDVTMPAGLDFRGWGMAVAWADYDGDGRLDLLVTAYGHCVLYHNEGNGRFTDASASTGIGTPEGFWTGAAWGDYDRDGRLDLYLTGYVRYTRELGDAKGRYDVENPASINPLSFPGERNLLFHNEGNGKFTERSEKAGVVNGEGRGLAATWADLDEDGWPDLYVANDVSANALFRNRGDGTFEDIGERAAVTDYRSSMGIAVGDWNRDGHQDLFLTHWITQGNALYDNRSAGSRGSRDTAAPRPLSFADEADRYGLGQISLDFTGWATSFIDFDDDGMLDLFVVNGSTLQHRDDPKQLVPMPAKVFWNRGPSEGFYDLSPVSGAYFRNTYDGRGAAFADYDNDGDVDVFVVNRGGPGILLRNDGGNRGHWLQVELRGTQSNRQGIGATVRVVAGGASQIRQIGVQAPYLSQNSLIETFGLGALTQVDTLEVRWPSGHHQRRAGIAARQRLTVVEAGDILSDRERVQAFWTAFREATVMRTAHRATAAVEGYERALAMDPNHEDALYYVGSLRFDLGDFHGAADAWRRLVAVNPRSGRAHAQLGALFLCAQDGVPAGLDSAEAHLKIADAINPEQNGPRLRLGEAALLRHDLDGARGLLEAVVRTDANNRYALFYLGYLAWTRGDERTARAEYVRAASAPRPGAPVAGASNEGDTRQGGPAASSVPHRCDAMRALVTAIRPDDGSSAVVTRYRRLDALVRTRVRRARPGQSGGAVEAMRPE